MIPNRFRPSWAEEKSATNGWLSVDSSFTAEIIAFAGYRLLAGAAEASVGEVRRLAGQACRAASASPEGD